VGHTLLDAQRIQDLQGAALMSLPKKASSNVRYLPSSAFNCYVTILNPDAGQAGDGTPNAATVVAQNVHANVTQWRGKEVDKSQDRVGISSYKIIIRYPKTYLIDTGMQFVLRDQLHNIESFSDPDGQKVELHIWTFVTQDTAGCM
jgi:SPP1 family predicted phage head-tail adaptor